MPSVSESVAHRAIASTHGEKSIVLTPESSITHENCSAVEKNMEDAMQQGKTEIILDCKQVGFLDSAALEILLEAHAALLNTGGALKIIGLNEVCRDILLATRLIGVFFVYKDMREAITHNP